MPSPFLSLGFRSFFLAAGIYAVLSVLVWFAVYISGLQLPLQSLPSHYWHAHEMVYGYAMAVIAGFVLTATVNWTGLQTLNGLPLLMILCCWVMARILFFTGQIAIASVLDLFFLFIVGVAIFLPIWRARLWKQMAVASKILLFFTSKLVFYLGVIGILDNGVYIGIYAGLYLVIGLILMMGRRVIPFFIEKGVGYYVQLYNSKVVDISSMLLFTVFVVLELTQYSRAASAYIALVMFGITAFRLVGWHTIGLWKKTLLWSLYCASWFISLGFLLHALAYFIGISPFIAVHAFAYAGIGIMTLGMMARVSLGHTGRNIHQLPSGVTLMFLLLIIGAVVRVILPLFLDYYLLWIGISQVLWVIAFLIFCYQYFPILTKENISQFS